MQEPKIEFTAKVEEFKPNASSDRFEDGSFASYHLSRITLATPKQHAGKELKIYHSRDVAEDSPWRQIGETLCFNALESRMMSGRQLFVGAVSDLCAAK